MKTQEQIEKRLSILLSKLTVERLEILEALAPESTENLRHKMEKRFVTEAEYNALKWVIGN